MNPELNEEFTWWYERVFCQSPSMCELKYDDEKMWEAWKVGYKLGRDNAFKRKDIPPEIFTIPKEKHVHTMNIDKDSNAPQLKEPQYLYVYVDFPGYKLAMKKINQLGYVGKIKLEVEDE
jgi:hypothetical protein